MTEKMQKAMVTVSTTVPLAVLLAGFFWFGSNLATMRAEISMVRYEITHMRELMEKRNDVLVDHGNRLVRIEAYLGMPKGGIPFDGQPRSSQ